MTPRHVLGRILCAAALVAAWGTSGRLIELAESGIPCPEPLDVNATTHIDWADFLSIRGPSLLPNERALIGHASRRAGPQAGCGPCQLLGKDAEGYEVRSGDASYLAPGTPMFAHKSKSPETHIVVRKDEGSLVLCSIHGEARMW